MMQVKDVLRKNGFRFEKKYGQNFLTDEKLLESLVEMTGVGKDDTVVEIGVGAGSRSIGNYSPFWRKRLTVKRT